MSRLALVLSFAWPASATAQDAFGSVPGELPSAASPSCPNCLSVATTTGQTRLTWTFSRRAGITYSCSGAYPQNAKVGTVYLALMTGTPGILINRAFLTHYAPGLHNIGSWIISNNGYVASPNLPLTLFSGRPLEGTVWSMEVWPDALPPGDWTLTMTVAVNWTASATPPPPPMVSTPQIQNVPDTSFALWYTTSQPADTQVYWREIDTGNTYT